MGIKRIYGKNSTLRILPKSERPKINTRKPKPRVLELIDKLPRSVQRENAAEFTKIRNEYREMGYYNGCWHY